MHAGFRALPEGFQAAGGTRRRPKDYNCGLTSLVTDALAETDFSKISVSQLLPMGSSAYETDPRGLPLGATLGKERKTGETRAPVRNAPPRPASTDLRQRPRFCRGDGGGAARRASRRKSAAPAPPGRAPLPGRRRRPRPWSRGW